MWTWFLLVIAPLALSGAARRPALPASSASYAITGLRAQLYYDDTGTLSVDMLAARDTLPVISNILNSQATFVTVEVTGPATFTDSPLSVEVAVRSAGKEVLRRQQHMPMANRQGRRFVGFWVYDTGCRSLEISAAILGQADHSRHVERLSFRCGE